jgi:hypothetical protein
MNIFYLGYSALEWLIPIGIVLYLTFRAYATPALKKTRWISAIVYSGATLLSILAGVFADIGNNVIVNSNAPICPKTIYPAITVAFSIASLVLASTGLVLASNHKKRLLITVTIVLILWFAVLAYLDYLGASACFT